MVSVFQKYVLMGAIFKRNLANKEKIMKKIFVFFCLMVAMSSSSLAADPIKIGAIFSKTGIAAIHNAPLIEMLELAAEEINQEGGLKGGIIGCPTYHMACWAFSVNTVSISP